RTCRRTGLRRQRRARGPRSRRRRRQRARGYEALTRLRASGRGNVQQLLGAVLMLGRSTAGRAHGRNESEHETTMEKKFERVDTKLIHAGEPHPRVNGAVAMPIFQTAMFEYAGEKDYHALRYIRLNNTPNHDVLHAKLAALENAEAALVTASGMAAISTTLLTLLTKGDHLLVQDSLYGGTHDLVTKDFAGFGIDHDFVDGGDPGTWESKLRPTTKAFYLESVSNPLLKVPDIEAAVEFAKAHGLVTVIDNTFPSPFNFRPIEWGIDLSLHSCTKYLNGHSDIVAGAVIG